MAFSDRHLDGCSGVLVEAFVGDPWREDWTQGAAARRLAEVRNTPGFVGFVALDGSGAPAGFLFGVRETTAGGDVFCIQWLCTRPDVGRRGIGGALLGEMEDAPGRLGVGSSYLLTARNPSLQEFYGRHGYRVEPGIVYMKR